MSTLKGRLDQIADTLTAEERASLSLRRWKEGLSPDTSRRAPMSDDEERKLTRLLKMIAMSNTVVALTIHAIEERVNAAYFNATALLSLEAMRRVLVTCSEAFVLGTDELVTESEHTALQKGKRSRVKPEWARAIRVVPDEERDSVETAREMRSSAQSALDVASMVLGGLDEQHEPGGVRELFAEQLRSEVAVAWREVRAIECGLDELQRELGGEDPLAEKHRQVLTGCRERLRMVAGMVVEVVGAIELPEPEQAERKLVRDLLRAG